MQKLTQVIPDFPAVEPHIPVSLKFCREVQRVLSGTRGFIDPRLVP